MEYPVLVRVISFAPGLCFVAAGVATLVSRLRARFGADAIIGGRAGYRLGAAVQVDLDEAAYRVLMRACAMTGEPARACQRLRHALAAEFGTAPAPATQELYLAALRGERF